MTEKPPGYRVLVVDDDESVRKVTMRALETFGFTTLGARDGFEAVTAVREADPGVDCVIVDMVMPGMDGEATMHSLHEVKAQLPVLLSSGHSALDMQERFAGAGFAGYLQKPYQIGALAQVVRETIEKGSG